jgi:hypothetical protein
MINITEILGGIPLVTSTFIISFILYYSAKIAKLSGKWAYFIAMSAAVFTAFSLNGITEQFSIKLLSAFAGVILAPRVIRWFSQGGNDE